MLGSRLAVVSAVVVLSGGGAASDSVTPADDFAVSGSITTAEGVPAENARVVVLGAPDARRKMRVGERRNVPVLAESAADDAGRFTVRVPRAAVAALTDQGGRSNLTILTYTADEVGVANISTETSASGQSMMSRSTFDERPITMMKQVKSLSPNQDRSVAAGCTTLLERTTTPRSVIVHTGYNTTTGVEMRYAWFAGASNTLGYGWSASYSGPWQVQGTKKNTSETTIGWGPKLVSTNFATTARFGYYATRCDFGVPSSKPNWVEYQHYDWGGGATSTNATSLPSHPYCVVFQTGSYFQKTDTSATEISNGINSTGDIGFNLSAQTGYSTQSQVNYKFITARHLCGRNNAPAGSSPAPGTFMAVR